jgi:membrane protease YdiL (CAAX protease family)
MAGWLEVASKPAGSLAPVYLELVLALALLATVLHFRRRRETPAGELKAVRTYFLACASLLLVLPGLTVWLTAARPLDTLVSFGWTFGRVGRGAVWTAVFLPVAVWLGYLSSRNAEMRKMYPLAKAALADGRTFAGYELSYLFLYYLSWESVFRGVLFLPLVPAIGLLPALAVQTIVSTLLHVGHPDPEVLAAAGAGLVFGLIAYSTGSFFYPLAIHATSGIALDIFIFLRLRRGRA